MVVDGPAQLSRDDGTRQRHTGDVGVVRGTGCTPRITEADEQCDENEERKSGSSACGHHQA